ncbi:prepilin-type N-terminal cleavage/methylation domain-containing protein [Planococcus maritimus]|uniref:type IV pilus modification PilV family protein n=1 Tax=Planococcus maritimus TaxID=192421 RepID=UPI00313A29BA
MKNEKGFTLVEVLAALVIISIILTSSIAIFSNTNALAVRNSEKLVVINLADAYLERIKADPTGTISNGTADGSKTISELINLKTCSVVSGTQKKVCPGIVLSSDLTRLNGKQYKVTVQFSQTQSNASSRIHSEKDLQLINVLVTVGSPTSKITSSVEGYIADEKTSQ